MAMCVEADKTRDEHRIHKGTKRHPVYKWLPCGTPREYLVSPAMQQPVWNGLFLVCYFLFNWNGIEQPPKIVIYTHYSVVIIRAMASQITGVAIVCSAVRSGADQRKHQSSASLAFVRGIHRSSQRASSAENVSIWWRHHINNLLRYKYKIYICLTWTACCVLLHTIPVVLNLPKYMYKMWT